MGEMRSSGWVLRKAERIVVLAMAASVLTVIAGCGGGGSSTSDPIVTGVTASCSPASITSNQTSTCTATVAGTDSYSSAATWSVSPASIGSVSSSGVFTPSGAGTATITATSTEDTSKSGSASVTVTPPATITSVTVTCSPSSITTAQISTCTSTVAGTGAFSDSVTWSASPTTIGSVSTTGVFTPTTTGTGTITATSTQDSSKSGSATVSVSPPTPTTAITVPSILIAGQQTQVTVTCYVRGADQNTQVQLFNLASGSPTLVGSMNDSGQNGDKTAGDQVFAITTTLTPSTSASLPLQVVATEGTANSENANFSVPLIQIPTYTTNSDVNQAESQIYNTAISTRSSFSSPDWSKPTLLSSISANVASIFGQFTGVVSQNPILQPSSVKLTTATVDRTQPNNVRANSIVGSVLDALTFGLLSPAQNANSCNQLVQSLGGFRDSATVPVLAVDDPNLQEFAQELASICTTDATCQGAFTADDFLGGNVAAAEWAQEYVTSGQPLPTAIDGCGGGVTQSLGSVAVKTEVSQFTDLAGDGLNSLAGGGEISQQLVGQVNDTLIGWAVDGSGKSTVVIGQAGANETFASPAGTYNLASSFGGSTANGTIINTPVYPNSITNISPSADTSLTVTPPYVTSLTPSSGIAGTPVTINGTGFDSNSSGNAVTFNGVTAQVTSSTATSIQTTVPYGTASGPVSVTNSNGSTTSSAIFTVTGSIGNPIPIVNSLFPNTTIAGAASQLLTINGAGFVPSSTVMFNGIAHPVTFVGTNRITTILFSSDLSTAGTYRVIVTNPLPGGGSSIAATFTINSSAPTDSGEWTWMSGSNAANGVAVYGTEGVSSPNNVPSARVGSSSWVDSSGNLWLFGGSSMGGLGALNDLWEFDPTSKQWTWKSGGPGTAILWGVYAGVYGEKGVAAPGNRPGGRSEASSWLDSSGNLWLFGGEGIDSTGAAQSELNDLWEYSPITNLWIWISGSMNGGATGVYGTMGEASPLSVPGGRLGAASWIDVNGDFWMFGGFGSDSTGDNNNLSFSLNDLWKFSPNTGEWTWMGGSDTGDAAGVYGTLGLGSINNIPGPRWGASTWVDSSGKFWLFGGEFQQEYRGTAWYLNDMWVFDPASGEWTWVSGSNSGNVAGIYGTRGIGDVGNTPGARIYAVTWTDKNGILWLFGGESQNGLMNDLWKFDPATRIWTWVGGSSTPNASGIYGTLGIPSAANIPGARVFDTSWTDWSGNLWLFGGTGYFAGGGGNGYILNDLWMYRP